MIFITIEKQVKISCIISVYANVLKAVCCFLQMKPMSRHGRLSAKVRAVQKLLLYNHKRQGGEAWKKHVQQKDTLKEYAEAIKELAEVHWPRARELRRQETGITVSRRQVTRETSERYFTKEIQEWIEVDRKNAKRLGIDVALNPDDYKPWSVEDRRLKLLDIGSCFDPYRPFEEFDVTALDLQPAAPDVHEADFFEVPILDEVPPAEIGKPLQLQRSSFDVIVSSFVVSYLPSSKMRFDMFARSLELLDTNGLMFMYTPCLLSSKKTQHALAACYQSWSVALQLSGYAVYKSSVLSAPMTSLILRKTPEPSIPILRALHNIGHKYRSGRFENLEKRLVEHGVDVTDTYGAFEVLQAGHLQDIVEEMIFLRDDLVDDPEKLFQSAEDLFSAAEGR